MSPELAAGPSDTQILDALGGAVCGQAVVSIERHHYRYTTSYPLEELRLRLADNSSLVLILKDLCWDRLSDEARRSKPAFLYEPRRELETYRRILGPSGIGPRCYATEGPESASGPWLLLEKVRGVELWQIGDLKTWESVARWVAGMHIGFLSHEELRSTNPYLLHHDAEWFGSWAERARSALSSSGDERASQLLDVLDRYGEIATALAALPTTFVHGEFFPSNILVEPGAGGASVWPVDWEMAAIGPGLIDLAALVAGWERADRDSLVSAYRRAMLEHGVALGSDSTLLRDVTMCQLHLALQWVGWAREWRPPPEHARDWVAEALRSAGELSL